METIRTAGPKLKSFFYHTCKPIDTSLIRGCVVVLHGAEGYGGRYEPFGNELAKNGYAMFAIDHIGHGKTALDAKEDLGKWEEDDFHYSAYNAYYLVDQIKKMYPGKPVYLLGDDYGGTMAQYMVSEFDNIFDGIIIASCGMPTLHDRFMFIKCLLKKKLFYDGGKSKGTFKSRTRFLNMHFRPTRTKYDWMNSDPREVDRFIEDPLSGFVGTIGYYYYQYKYIVKGPNVVKLKKANKDIPILMIGGRDDYITHCGAQISKLERHYVKKGFKKVSCILYNRSRHDILLEWNKAEIARDIADWINKNSFKEDVIVEKAKSNAIVEIKPHTLGEMTTIITDSKETPSFVEEEPDDLRLSTKLKK